MTLSGVLRKVPGRRQNAAKNNNLDFVFVGTHFSSLSYSSDLYLHT